MKPPFYNQCSFCSQRFTCSDVGRNSCTPLLLQCAHNICRGCAANVSTECNFIQCSSCFQKTNLTDGGLPADYYLLGFLLVNAAAREGTLNAGIKFSAGISDPVVCEECGKDAAVLLCDKCEGNRFCQSCFSLVHGSSKLLSRHVPSKLAETTSIQLHTCFRRLHGQLQLREIKQLEQYQTTAPAQIEAVVRQLENEMTNLSDTSEIDIQSERQSVPQSPPSSPHTPSLANQSSVDSVSTSADQPSALHQLLYNSPLLNSESSKPTDGASIPPLCRQYGALSVGSTAPAPVPAPSLLGPVPLMNPTRTNAVTAGFGSDRRLAANLNFPSQTGSTARHLAATGDNSDRHSQTSQHSSASRNSASSSLAGRQQQKFVLRNVVVTHFTSPASFYVRQQSFDQRLINLQWRVQQVAGAAASYLQQPGVPQPPRSIPSKGQLCLARYSGDQTWCRARVVNLHYSQSAHHQLRPANKPTLKLDVIYIDYGNTERLPLSRVRAITADLVNLAPPLAICCSLAGIEPCSGPGSPWPQQTINELARLIRGAVFVMTTLEVRADNTHMVELTTSANPHIRQDEPVSLQQHLVMLQLARHTSTQKPLPSPTASSTTTAATASANNNRGQPSSTARINQPPAVTTTTVSMVTDTSAYTNNNNGVSVNRNSANDDDRSSSNGSYQTTDNGVNINNNRSQLMPQSLIDMRTFYPPETLRRASQTTVMISHVESPMRFCVQQLGVHCKCMHNMMDEIQEVYSSVGAGCYNLLNPLVGQVCVARYAADKKYYRAVIEQVCTRDQVHVLYVDYGNRQQVPLDWIKKIEDRFITTAQQALWCCLADVVPLNGKTDWSTEATQYFSRFADRPLKMYVDEVSGSSNTVTLYLSEGGTSMCINALLVRNGFAMGVGPSTRNAQLTKNSGGFPARAFHIPQPGEGRGSRAAQPLLPIQQTGKTGRGAGGGGRGGRRFNSTAALPGGVTAAGGGGQDDFDPAVETSQFDLPTHGESGTSVTVSHFVSPADFWVRKTSDANELKALVQSLQGEYGETSIISEPPIEWKCGDMAVASCSPSRCFYRLQLLQLIDDDCVKALLIDSGETVELKVQQLRLAREQFAKVPPFATHCCLDGIRPAGDNSAKWTGFACDFTRQMIDKSYRLFLINKSEIPADSEQCVLCDLEVEEEMSVGALEPSRVIRTSLAMKLVNEGLAFRGAMNIVPNTTVHDTITAQPVALSSQLSASVSGGSVTSLNDVTSQSDSSETEVDSSDSRVSTPLPLDLIANKIDGSTCVKTEVIEGAVVTNESDDASVGSGVSDCSSEDGGLPVGSDWASMRIASAMAPLSDAEDHDQQVRDDELAADVVTDNTNKKAGDGGISRGWLPVVLPEVGASFEATATHVSMAGIIHLYSKHSGGEALKAISSMLQSQLQNSEPRPCDTEGWALGEPCFAKYYLDRKWYRAQVVKKHSNDRLSVLFIDYGNTDKVDSADLRRNIFADEIPIQSLACQLHNIVPLSESGQFPVKTLDWIHKQVVDKDCRIHVHCVNKNKRRLLVSLQLLCSGLDIGYMLVQMGAARRMLSDELTDTMAAINSGEENTLDGGDDEGGPTAVTVSVLLHGAIKQLQLPVSSSRQPVPVLCSGVITPDLVLIQPQAAELSDNSDDQQRQLNMHVKQLAELPDRLAALAEHQLPVQAPLSRGGLCLAHSLEDDLWYRAAALDDDVGSCLVLLIDYGLQETIPYDRLRELPECMRVVPGWIILVRLHAVEPVDADVGWTDDNLNAVQACLFSDQQQLYVRLKTEALPPQVELVVRHSPGSKPRLAYQSLIDQGHFRLKGRPEVTFADRSDGSSPSRKPHSD